MNAQLLPLFLFSFLLLLQRSSAVVYPYPTTTPSSGENSFPSVTDGPEEFSFPTKASPGEYPYPGPEDSDGYSNQFDLAPAPAPGYYPPTSGGDDEFIRRSCRITLHPDICYTSLSGYARAVQQDLAKLTQISVRVSLLKAKDTAVYYKNATRWVDKSSHPTVVGALHDCYSVFSDAVDQMRGSMKQLSKIGGSAGSIRFQMSNVQTWMSAALTNENTCTDGFEDLPNSAVKKEICDRAVKAIEVTSNALALINSYASLMMTQ